MNYSMKETCKKTNLTYDTLKYYCNEGLVPNVKRDKNNYRIFSDEDIKWINNLSCLKKCGMSIQETKKYIELCKIGNSSIPERKEILSNKQKELEIKKDELQQSIDFINYKQKYYNDILNQNNK